VGAIVLLVNFPNFLLRTIEVNVTNLALRNGLEAPVRVIQMGVSTLVGAQPELFFARAMTCAFVLFWLFVILTVIFAARKRTPILLACGIGGIFVGYVTVHLLAWGAFVLAVAIGGALFVVRWVGLLFAALAAFLSHHLVVALIIALVAVTLTAVVLFKSRVFVILARIAGAAAVIAAGIWLLSVALPALYRWIILPVLRFLQQLLGPLLHVLLIVLKWIVFTLVGLALVVFGAAVVLASMALLGSLLVSQIQAGWHAARSSKLMLVAGFAIGSALSLIVLVSATTPVLATHAVTDSFLFILPSAVKSFAMAYLTNMQAPAVDSLTFMVIVALAFLSICLRLLGLEPAEEEDVTIKFVVEEYVKMAGGLFVGLVMIALVPLAAINQS